MPGSPANLPDPRRPDPRKAGETSRDVVAQEEQVSRFPETPRSFGAPAPSAMPGIDRADGLSAFGWRGTRARTAQCTAALQGDDPESQRLSRRPWTSMDT